MDTTDALRYQNDDETSTDYETYLIGQWTLEHTKHVGMVVCVQKYEAQKN